MKSKVKVLIKILLLLFAIWFLANTKVNAETEKVDGITWNYTVEDGKAVDVYIQSGTATNTLTVPDTLGGYEVTRIGSTVEKVNIAGLLYTNSDYSKFNIKVTTIILPDSVKELNDYCFAGMRNVTSIHSKSDDNNLPNITKIGNYAFYNCSKISSLGLPNTVTEIGNNAFYACSMLTSISIPNSVTSIGEYAFYNCTKLTSISIPNSVTSIGEYAFYNCQKLTSISIPASVTSIGRYAVGYCTTLVEANVSAEIAELPTNMFYGCSKLETVTLPNTLTTIGTNAFQNCSALNNISIPETVTLIDNYAFNNCSKLESIIIPSGIQKIGNMAFSGCALLNNVVIPDNIETIGGSIFSNCKNLDTITLPTGLTEIPTGMFSGCTKIDVEDILSRNITKIGQNAFSNCTQLITLNIPDTVTEIGNSAFSGCTELTTVVLPHNMDEWGSYIFQNCTKLTTINLPTDLTYIPVGMFSGCTSLNVLGVLTENISVIKASAFYRCTQLTNFTIPSNIVEIEASAFSYCTGLTTVVVPASVTKVGDYCFAYNTNLNSITFEAENVEFGKGVFYNDTSLETCNLPSGTTVIRENMFAGCDRIDIEAILNNITVIENYAFSGGSKSYNELTIPDSVVEMGSYVFGNGKKIYKLYIGSGIEKIGMNSLFKAENTYINREAGSVELGVGNDNGGVYYTNTKPKLTLNLLPGIKVINTETNEELVEGPIDYGTDLLYQIVVEDGYEYDNLYYIFTRKPNEKYRNQSSNYDNVVLNSNVEYINGYYAGSVNTGYYYDIQRDFTITTQQIENNADYVVRQYISKVNNQPVSQSREPVFEIKNGIRNYKHTKLPVDVESGDIVRYIIRVYNEGRRNGYAQEITEFIPENMELAKGSAINIAYGWVESEDGRTATTDYLKSTVINAYSGSISNITYQEVAIDLKVLSNRTEESKYVTAIAEVTKANPIDVDSTGSEVSGDMLENYKMDESLASNSESYIAGDKDNYDYDAVVIPSTNDISTDYKIVIEKIDSLTGEMLNGAKFNLTDEEGNILQSGVTVQDGTLDFGMMSSVGDGTDVYYIEEVQRPEGYNNPLTYKIRITVEKSIYDYINGLYTLDVYCDLVDIDINLSRYEEIPIYTKEQFKKIGSHEEVEINGESFLFDNTKVYKLMNDIDLADENWVPINTDNCMINGNNYSVKNLTITTDLSDIKRVGLFGTFSGYVVDLNLADVNINVEKPDSMEQPKDSSVAIGALAGYMSQGIIRNCTLSGEITTNVYNVGGFVGHTENGGILVFNNSTNNINITGTKVNNIGGFVGVALGSVSIKNCVNNGNITHEAVSNNDNGAGFIGVAEPKGYEPSAVKASYNKDSKVITLTIKNESIMGKYKVRLENRDVQTLNLIEGSVFDILDENKEIINEYRNVVLTKGVLDVATIDINSVGTDIYYIKQISTPEGYEVISDEFIKVTVTKTWNIEKDVYEVKVDTEIINDEQYTLEEPTEDVNTSKTGIIHRIMEYTNVVWTSDKIYIKDSINNGVISEFCDGSGFVALANSIVEIDNAQNNGTIQCSVISGNFHLAGIVGMITKPSEFSYALIKNSNNNAEINDAPGSDSSNSTMAGIVGLSVPKTTFINCKNEANLSSGSTTAAGIIGIVHGDIYVYNCENNGDLVGIGVGYGVGSGRSSGGIVGKTLGRGFISSKIGDYNPGSCYGNDDCYRDIVIDNCKNTGSISKTGHLGGMIGFAYGMTVKVTNCSVIGTENRPVEFLYAKGDNGGMIGFNDCGVTIVDNCNVEYLKIEAVYSGTSGSTGGIIGNTFMQYSQNDDFDLRVTNCSAKNIDFKAGRDIAGILGMIQRSHGVKSSSILIENCTVENANIYDDFKDNSYAGAAGIVSCMYEKINTIKFKNCSVKNSNICLETKSIAQVTSGDMNAGGILAKLCNADSFTMDNCDVENTIVNNVSTWAEDSSNTTVNTGGIIGSEISGGNIKKYTITNCDLKGSEVNATMGDCSGISPIYGQKGIVEIGNCTVTDSRIVNTADRDCSQTSGIVTMLGSKSDVFNCHDCYVKDSFVSGKGDAVGGIVGSVYYSQDATITNCFAENIEIERIATNKDDCVSVGGIVGDSLGGVTISKCYVKGITINSDANGNAGIVGLIEGNANVEECKVIDSTINTGLNEIQRDQDHVGGIAGIVKIGNINKCEVINTDINSKTGYMGGITALALDEVESITNNKLENVTIHYYNDYNERKGGEAYWNKPVGGIVGIVRGGITKTLNINNNTIDGLDIIADCNDETEYSNVGGIVGIDVIKNVNIEENDITGLNITNATLDGYTGGIVGYGENVNIKDVTITNDENDTGITGKNFVGGAIGLGDIVNIEDVIFNNVNINTDSVVGGMIGVNGETIRGVISTSFSKVLFDPTQAIIHNIVFNNVAVNGKEIAGGLVGCTDDETTIEIDTVSINDSSVKSEESMAGGLVGTGKDVTVLGTVELNKVTVNGADYAGGIAAIGHTFRMPEGATISESSITGVKHSGGVFGATDSIASIKNTIVEGSKVESTGEDGISGGLVGVASNVDERECEISIENSQVKGKTTGEVTKESEIKAINHAGGMIGFTTIGSIKNSNVTNTKVTSTSGIVGGLAAVVSLTDNEIAAQAEAAENGTAYTGRTVSKLSIIESTVSNVVRTGLNYVNELLGCGNIE